MSFTGVRCAPQAGAWDRSSILGPERSGTCHNVVIEIGPVVLKTSKVTNDRVEAIYVLSILWNQDS